MFKCGISTGKPETELSNLKKLQFSAIDVSEFVKYILLNRL